MLRRLPTILIILALVAITLSQSPAPEGARVYLIAPADGAAVTGPVLVQFGLSGMGIAPAGIEVEATGHHHLLIDLDAADLDLGQPLPANDNVRHFGKGQTEVLLELAPGSHTLQLVLGNHLHLPHDPPIVSEKITITVQ
jgi:hypothetical protein